jgi:hypothetical protein
MREKHVSSENTLLIEEEFFVQFRSILKIFSRILRILNLCKICVFHDGNYVGCLLGYRNPVHTSQETPYVSATEPNRLILC